MASIPGQPSPKPQSVASAKPTAPKESADALLSELSADDLLGELDAGSASLAPVEEPIAPSPGEQLIDETNAAVGIEPGAMTDPAAQRAGAARMFDALGGGVRTAGAALAEQVGKATGAVPPEAEVVSREDIVNAIKGKAPKSAEYLQRLGLGEGGSISIPIIKANVSTRDAQGFALDILSDPLFAVSKLVKKAPLIGKVIGAPGAASEKVGEAIYKSGLRKIDAKLAEKGENAVSPLLLAEGKTGSSAQIAKAAQEMADTMGSIRKDLYERATSKGVTIDLGYPMKRAEAVLKGIRDRRGQAPLADELEELLNRYKAGGPAPIGLVSDMKTELYDSLPASAFSGLKMKGAAAHFKAALAADLREKIVDAGNVAERGLGDSIEAVNEKWGTLLSAFKPLMKQATGEAAGQNTLGRSIDAAFLGTGNLPALATKKALDLGTSTYAKTKFGKALMDAAKVGAIDAMARRAYVNTQKEKPKK